MWRFAPKFLLMGAEVIRGHFPRSSLDLVLRSGPGRHRFWRPKRPRSIQKSREKVGVEASSFPVSLLGGNGPPRPNKSIGVGHVHVADFCTVSCICLLAVRPLGCSSVGPEPPLPASSGRFFGARGVRAGITNILLDSFQKAATWMRPAFSVLKVVRVAL
jgi:hypothetical protein